MKFPWNELCQNFHGIQCFDEISMELNAPKFHEMGGNVYGMSGAKISMEWNGQKCRRLTGHEENVLACVVI